MDAPLIISIWRVDPVGGEYLDWPNDNDHADAGPPHLWSSNELTKPDVQYLSRLPNANRDGLWIAHNDLGNFQNECRTVRDNAQLVCGTIGYSEDRFRQHIDNLINAAQFARTIDEAGVYIG